MNKKSSCFAIVLIIYIILLSLYFHLESNIKCSDDENYIPFEMICVKICEESAINLTDEDIKLSFNKNVTKMLKYINFKIIRESPKCFSTKIHGSVEDYHDDFADYSSLAFLLFEDNYCLREVEGNENTNWEPIVCEKNEVLQRAIHAFGKVIND